MSYGPYKNLEQLKEAASNGSYLTHGKVTEADCVIGFSFGYHKLKAKILPGFSNQDLGKFVAKNLAKLPKILQFEIADSLAVGSATVHRIEHHRQAGQYLDSLEVAKQAQAIMNANSWAIAVLVAHPYHVPRCDSICAKLGIKTIVPKGLETIRFDPESAQEWTRSHVAWKEREIGVIDYFAAKSWI